MVARYTWCKCRILKFNYSHSNSLIWSRMTAASSNLHSLIAKSIWALKSFAIISFSFLVILLSFLSWTFHFAIAWNCWFKSISVLTDSKSFAFELAFFGLIPCSLLNLSWISLRRYVSRNALTIDSVNWSA